MRQPSDREYLRECTVWLRALGPRFPGLEWSAHASGRMMRRGVLRPDVREVLRTGRVAEVRGEEGMEEQTWRVEGVDLQNRRVCVVLGVRSRERARPTVVTVFEIEG